MHDIENKATEIYCIVADLLNVIARYFPHGLPMGNKKGQRGRLSIWEAPTVITLCILEFLYHSSEIKSFFYLARPALKKAFGGWISYERYLQLRCFYAPYAGLCLCLLFEPLKKTGLYFVDSAPLKVCHVKRASRHKVMAGIASKSKNSMGWYFGLKLHLVVNPWQEIVSFQITSADVDDRKPLKKLLRKLEGLVAGDAGYVSEEWRKFFKEMKLHLFTGVRNNMKKLMTIPQHTLLKSRQIVETVLSTLLSRFHIARSLPRSVMGHLANYLFGILAYCLDGINNGTFPNTLPAA